MKALNPAKNPDIAARHHNKASLSDAEKPATPEQTDPNKQTPRSRWMKALSSARNPNNAVQYKASLNDTKKPAKPKQTDPKVLKSLRMKALSPAKDPNIAARQQYKASLTEAKKPAKHGWDQIKMLDILLEVEVGWFMVHYFSWSFSD